jgi:hypothetical protein
VHTWFVVHVWHATPEAPHWANVPPATHCPVGVQQPPHVPKRQLLEASLVVASVALSSRAASLVPASSLLLAGRPAPPALGAPDPLVSIGGCVGGSLHEAKSTRSGTRAIEEYPRSLMPLA